MLSLRAPQRLVQRQDCFRRVLGDQSSSMKANTCPRISLPEPTMAPMQLAPSAHHHKVLRSRSLQLFQGMAVKIWRTARKLKGCWLLSSYKAKKISSFLRKIFVRKFFQSLPTMIIALDILGAWLNS